MSEEAHTHDARIGNSLIWLKARVGSVRNLRDLAISAVKELGSTPEAYDAVIVLPEPGISQARLRDEWDLLFSALRPELARRIHFLTVENQRFLGLPGTPPQQFLEELRLALPQALNRPGRVLPRQDYGDETLKLLMVKWARHEGFLSLVEVQRELSCSQPTATKTVGDLEAYLERGPHRSFALQRFPSRPWEEYVVAGQKSRLTRRFADRSGKPRSVAKLLGNLTHLNRSDIGVGGVTGAKRFFPNLDISGVPRLDLTIHCPDGDLNAAFVRELDPALKETEDLDEPASVVVHALRRQHPYFVEDPDRVRFADPIECLADLHEARLEMQAAELRRHIETRAVPSHE